MMDTLLAVGVGAYVLSTAAYLGALWRPTLAAAARWSLRVALALWAGLLIWLVADGQTGVHLYLGFSAWSLCAVYSGLARRYPIAALGSVVTALATVLTVLGLLVAHTRAPVSDWAQSLLRVHIGLAFVGFTAFAFASAMSLVYLLQAALLKRKSPSPLRRRLPPLDVLDRLSLRGIIVGFPFYTAALLLGSVHAVQVNGAIKSAYVFAGLSWLIYGGVLQARLIAGWRGRRAAVLTLLGLAAALVVVTQYSLAA